MHHLYPLAKGDPLCPLGFHPQVRWPTRCKRCFRDYKEHGGKRRDDLRRDDTTSSSPSLSWNSRDNSDSERRRSWVSSTNLIDRNGKTITSSNGSNNNNTTSDTNYNNPSSWISTPDLANLEDDTHAVTFSIKLPKRKISIDTGQKTVSDSVSMANNKNSFNKDELNNKVKKTKLHKNTSDDRDGSSVSSSSSPSSSSSSSSSTSSSSRRLQIKEVKTISEEPTNHDVQFLIQLKSKPTIQKHKQNDIDDYNDNDDDTISTAGTETTDTTLVDTHEHELKEQLDSLKKELETTKAKCDRLEKDKSDILLRRLAAMETTTSKTTATEVLKLQQKCNELKQTMEDYKDEKKSLGLRVKELEEELLNRPTAQQAQKIADELRSKLLAAETLCEELMDENEDIKKEVREMEEQMDEMQDNFREDQVVEYTSLKKELDQTAKNCRILSFKLRKAERKVEQLEQEKTEAETKLKDVTGSQTTLANLDKIKQMEQELKVSNEVSLRLQTELDEANQKLSKFEESSKSSNKKKAPMLGSIGRISSGDGKISRETLTRGGSQDDPAQLLRDLQDSLEREADLREQLKFAEEEAQNLRKKVSRIEDDNESLVLQLKKMASRARSRKLSPTNNSRLTPEPLNEKIDLSDDEDPSEIKLQLELSEQESTVLRKKIEELEAENHKLKAKNKELHDKVINKNIQKKSTIDNNKNNSIQNQKVKILEDETNDLRKKLIEKERDCERLHAELSLNQKRSKIVQKSKSLDMDQHGLDIKRQLQVIDQEATILRTKVQSLEGENEKLITENKKLQLLKGAKTLKSDKNIDKYIDQIANLEIELEESNKKIKEMEEKMENSDHNGVISDLKLSTIKYKKFVDRIPKKISSLTSKDQLRTMINDLESEIGEMIVAIKVSENEKIKLEEEMKNLKHQKEYNKVVKDLDEMNKKFEQVQKDLNKEKEKLNLEKSKSDELNKTLIKTKETLNKANDEKKKLKEQIEKSKDEQQKIQTEKNKLDEEIVKLKSNLKVALNKQDELTQINDKVETFRIKLDTKEQELQQLKIELNEKNNIVIELNEKIDKLTKFEKKSTENEEKYKKLEKQKKEKIKDLENKINEEKNKNSKWEDDFKQYTIKTEDLNNKILSMETTIESKKKLIEELENNLKKERQLVSSTNLKVDELVNREITQLKEELSKTKHNLKETEGKLKASIKNKNNLEDKLKAIEAELKSNKNSYEKKTADIELELQNERKRIEILKANQDKENKNKELELSTLKSKIKTMELNTGKNNKNYSEIKQFQETIDKLENNFKNEKQKYDDLTAKYEILEEEHVATKAKLVTEKESLENQLHGVQHELSNIEKELKTLRETYNTKQDVWIKEKLSMQEKTKEMEKRTINNNELEKKRFKAQLEEKLSELDQFKKEKEVLHDQIEYMRKESDELRRKLDDYQKVEKAQRNISADNSALENELKQLKAKLNVAEKSKKSEVTECKMRYDSQLSIVNGELQSLQNQVLRFKRERDNYKHMFESAQKTISDLKNSPKTVKDNTSTPLHYDEFEESKNKVAALEQQISCMEDELSEARLESSRLKTELISERSSWEVKISELHSRVNELEEEKILNSGRTKVVGLRTRMELAWQKEREEQQRLLQETATLARDLRQTLFEVERERDKERLEAKRKQDQFKKSVEEDQDENKKKITELQCDLLELRDAHAKLRTTNEKLRREKERYEKEREELKLTISGRKRASQSEDYKLTILIEQIDMLKQIAPELFFSKDKEAPYTPTPPRRTRSSKSRETSPSFDQKGSSLSLEDKQQQIQILMQKLVGITEDLRKYQKLSDEDIEKERLKRAMGMRRATSTENDKDTIYNKILMRKIISGGTGSLRRKSLSLEHTIHNEERIWKNDNSMSSLHSLEGSSDNEWVKSMDSRLSGESTQSDYVGEKKKKKSFIGKLKKLTKSRSIDDQDPGTFSAIRQLSSKPNSNSEINEEKGSKKDLKERISGMFKRGGSSSRSNSTERSKTDVRHDTSSTQRPLMRNGSGSVASSSPSSSIEINTKIKSKKI